ncbi:MAG: PHP domain-containing protein [Armatimonadota bacterium]|nr:MAG: PHP domain-containing protein [Armatimonadota bacterium]
MAQALRRYRADLHVHTALSPCASEAMTPPAIITAARQREVDLIGAVDHNAAGNARALIAATECRGPDGPIHVLPGLEVESAEGVHVVCLCNSAEAAEAMQEFVWSHLPAATNRPEAIGEQSLLDAEGRAVRQETRLLLQATTIKLDELCREAARRGLLCVPAHVTRRTYGLLGVLGFVPDHLAFDALELGPPGRTPLPLAARPQADLGRLPQVRASDAHRLDDIGTACTDFWLAKPTVAELRLALRQRAGRRACAVPLGG